MPLWQVPQVPGATPAWSKPVAGRQAWLLWQLSQEAVVRKCVAGLPLDCTPLWQLAQVPRTTVAWFMRAPVKVRVVWQLSQVCSGVLMCAGVLTTLPRARRAPEMWQDSQSLGVPLN